MFSLKALFARSRRRHSSKRRKHNADWTASAEVLEDRRLLAADVFLMNGMLYMHGTSGNDAALVYKKDGQVTAAVTDGTTVATDTFAESAVRDIVFKGFEGDDAFLNFSDIAPRSESHSINELVLTGNRNDTLIGGDGDDRFIDLSGKARKSGDAGGDLEFGPAREDDLKFTDSDLSARDYPSGKIWASNGVLFISGTSASDAAVVVEKDGKLTAALTDGREAIRQTYYASTINTIFFAGYEGNDRFINFSDTPALALGHAGNDVILGGAGKNTLAGGGGDDLIVSLNTDDAVRGGQGTDFMVAVVGSDSGIATSDESSDGISGRWTFNGQSTAVRQVGRSLIVVNERGDVSSGRFLGSTSIRATEWGNLEGRIVGNRIEWANGTVWERANQSPTLLVDLTGTYAINGLHTRVEQSGSSMAFINEHGIRAEGRLINANRVEATQWGGLQGTFHDNRIEWDNGTTWALMSQPVEQSTPLSEITIQQTFAINGRKAEVRVEGLTSDVTPARLTFENEFGHTSRGRVVSPGIVEAIDWNLQGVVDLRAGQIRWANGTAWQVENQIAMTFNGHSTRIHAEGPQLYVVNEHGGRSSVFVTGDRITASNWGNLRGTVTADSIAWDNGTTWRMPNTQNVGTVNQNLQTVIAGTTPVSAPPAFVGTFDQNLNAISGNPNNFSGDFYSFRTNPRANAVGQIAAGAGAAQQISRLYSFGLHDVANTVQTQFQYGGFSQQQQLGALQAADFVFNAIAPNVSGSRSDVLRGAIGGDLLNLGGQTPRQNNFVNTAFEQQMAILFPG